MLGVPKRKIVAKLYQDLGGDDDSFYKLRNIYYILDSADYDDVDENANLQNQNASLNIYEQENEAYLTLLDGYESLIHMLKSKMRTGPFCSLIEPNELRHTLATGKGLLEMATNSLDERQLTHVPLINLFIQLAIKYTAADAYSHYYLEVKDLIKKMTAKEKIRGIRTLEAMSGKQAHETVYLKIKEIHYSLEPTDEHEARAKGFSGEKCPKCKSWRTDREPDATNTGRWYRCIFCEHKFEKAFIQPFMKPNAVSLDLQGNEIKITKMAQGSVTIQ